MNEPVWCVYDRIRRSGKRDGLYKDNLLLRGCTIRNTEEAVGIVIYAGTLRLSKPGLEMSTTLHVVSFPPHFKLCIMSNSALLSK